MKHDGLRMGAALAYYSAFSLAPLVLILVSIAGIFLGDETVRTAVNQEIESNMGPAGAAVIQELVANARKPSEGWMMTAFGLVLLLMGAAGVFAQLQAALNTIWGVPDHVSSGLRGFIKNRLLSFGMVLTAGLLLLISMVLSALIHGFAERISDTSGLPLGAWITSSGVFTFGITILLFAAIFKILPNAIIRWRDVWVGALVTALLFGLGRSLVSWYIGREATTSPYGSAGAFVIVLLWLHYSSLILLFGAEFTATHARLLGRGVSFREGGKKPKEPA